MAGDAELLRVLALLSNQVARVAWALEATLLAPGPFAAAPCRWCGSRLVLASDVTCRACSEPVEVVDA